MRLIVVGEVVPLSDGTMTGTAFFRYPVPASPASRQAYYAARQSSYQTAAPSTGDAAADTAENTAFQGGSYVEHVVTGAKFPQSATHAQLEQNLMALYQASEQAWVQTDNAKLQFWGSSWDGSATVYQTGEQPGWTVTSS